MNEEIEQAAVAVACVLDRRVFALGDAELFAGLQSLEDVVTLAGSSQAAILRELTRRDTGLRGATSGANSAQSGAPVVAAQSAVSGTSGVLLERF